MEGLIKEQRRKWMRMTGNTNVDEWIVYHAPTGIYLFYRNCANGYEKRRNKDRIRKRANRNISELLKSILEKNKIAVSVG